MIEVALVSDAISDVPWYKPGLTIHGLILPKRKTELLS